MAQAPSPSLTGSNFEIEADANLVLDVGGGATDVDWATVAETRKADVPSGSGDDSFGQGSKEDTAVPTVVDGSIPPNKSDLKTFGAYKEGDTLTGFLHLYWTRVQDPSGTTNMDFELNKSRVTSANGVTPVRSPGDILITYDLSNGGTKATIGKREWLASGSWGPYTPFGDELAVGTVNTSAITSANSDGLGALSLRTFGEASVKLTALFGITDPTAPVPCTTFGSAYLKSRSSDSFGSALKDFVAPTSINLTNCGTVNIVKNDQDGDPLAGATFTLYRDNAPIGGTRGAEDTATSQTCTTTSTPGLCAISNVPFGSFFVVETTIPANYDGADDQAFSLDSSTPNATVTLTFVNDLKMGTLVVEKEVVNNYGHTKAASAFSFTVDGGSSISFATNPWSMDYEAGTILDVAEVTDGGYSTTYKVDGIDADDCDDLAIVENATVTCTIINTDIQNAPAPGQTVQSWVLKDSITITGIFPGAANQSSGEPQEAEDPVGAFVEFSLWSDDECSVQEGGPVKIYAAAGNYSSANPQGFVTLSLAMTTAQGIAVTDSGDYYWTAEYSGDAYNAGHTTLCGTEKTEILAKDQYDEDPGAGVVFRDDF